MSATQPTMLLVTSAWQGRKAFKLMPITNDCPFTEGIYEPEGKILIMMSKETKETVHMLPRLDENGDPVMTKAPRKNGKTFKEQRVHIDTYTEHYILEKSEIIDLIKRVAVNADTFNYTGHLDDTLLVTPEKPKIELIK